MPVNWDELLRRLEAGAADNGVDCVNDLIKAITDAGYTNLANALYVQTLREIANS